MPAVASHAGQSVHLLKASRVYLTPLTIAVMEKDSVDPILGSINDRMKRGPSTRRVRLVYVYLLLAVSGALFYFGQSYWFTYFAVQLPPHAATSLARCRSLQAKPGPSQDFHKRSQSDRFEDGTQPILIKNAKIWTGEVNGTEVINADILLDKGIIKGIGRVEQLQLKPYKDDLVVIDAKNAWVTPGYACVQCIMLDY